MEIGNGEDKYSKGKEAQGCFLTLNFLKKCMLSKYKEGGETHSDDAARNESFAFPTNVAPPTPTINIQINPIPNLHLHRFTYEELSCATKNFRSANFVGQGGFGNVYKGWLIENSSGRRLPVAVKTLDHDGLQGHREWLAEVKFLGYLHHPNVVSLIGYCMEDKQRMLVYEYMPRGSLENHLFRRTSSLSWSVRMKVALDAAKGLAFLHEGAEKKVIYRDFKTSNILLDADFKAKISDFGLARDGPVGGRTHVSTRIVGTKGYAAPEYVTTGHLTTKSDVYSFGVVLLEILSGRKCVENFRGKVVHLVQLASPVLQEPKKFYKLIDPRLHGQFSPRAAYEAFKLAGHCLSDEPKIRPAMSQVVEALTSMLSYNDKAVSSPNYGPMFAGSSSRPGGANQHASPHYRYSQRTPGV